jgi:hypothetical protein
MHTQPFLPKYSVLRALDRAPHVHFKSMAQVHFGTSTFGSFECSNTLFSRSAFSRSQGSCTMRPSRLTVVIHFGRPSSPCCFLLASEVRDLSTCVSRRSMTMNHFSYSDFREFQALHTHSLLRCFDPKSTICRCVSPTD